MAVCSVKVCIISPVATSRRRIVPSRLPLASMLPSGLNAIVLTPSVSPVRVVMDDSVMVSHSCTVSSRLPLASVPRELNATLSTPSVCPSKVALSLVVAIAAASNTTASNSTAINGRARHINRKKVNRKGCFVIDLSPLLFGKRSPD